MFPNVELSKYIGTPYRHRGRDLKSGLDCWGLVLCIYKDLGFILRDLEQYEEEGHKKGYDYFLPHEKGEWIKKSFASPYDVALFLNSGGVAYHAGVVTNELKVIHADKNKGVVIIPLNAIVRSLTLDGYYKLKVNNGNSKA